MTKPDPLAAALLAAPPMPRGGSPLLIDQLFGDRPEVVDAIRAVRAQTPPMSQRHIAGWLSSEGKRVSEGAVRNWLLAKGIQ